MSNLAKKCHFSTLLGKGTRVRMPHFDRTVHGQNFKIKINARKMNHKILKQIKGGGFLAGDLPMSTFSNNYTISCGISCFGFRSNISTIVVILLRS